MALAKAVAGDDICGLHSLWEAESMQNKLAETEYVGASVSNPELFVRRAFECVPLFCVPKLCGLHWHTIWYVRPPDARCS